jgi:response regulator RpfG family c-di-GMP phosphodiesterase
MNITVFIASALLAAAGGFSTAWQIQEGRIEHEQNNRLTEQAKAQQELHAMEQARSTQVIAAQNSARERERRLRMDAATSDAVSQRLRSALAVAVQTARTDPNACVERTTTIGELLAECSAAFGSMAATADRVNADRQLMADSWPK